MKPSLGPFPPTISSTPAAAMYPPPAASPLMFPSPAFPDPYYHHPHPHHHQSSAPPSGPPIVYTSPEQQKIFTLFVSGLPDDVKPREIHNLFRLRPGFDSCLLEHTGRGNQAVAFATFLNHQSAVAAMSQLNGSIFDPVSGATLHIELARSNSRKRSHVSGAYLVIDKRVKSGSDGEDSSSNHDDRVSDERLDIDNDDSNEEDAATKSDDSHRGEKLGESDAPKKDLADIPPCSTLFIANLGPTCTEDELNDILSKYSGFTTLKMRGRGGMPVAFADFTDVESSVAALNSLLGTMLKSSDRGGMHVEYARSKMRKS